MSVNDNSTLLPASQGGLSEADTSADGRRRGPEGQQDVGSNAGDGNPDIHDTEAGEAAAGGANGPGADAEVKEPETEQDNSVKGQHGGDEELERLHKELLRSAEQDADNIKNVIEQIVRHDPNATVAPRDVNGNTPLHLLVNHFSVKDTTFSALVDRMELVDINALGSDKSAVLHIVSRDNEESLCRILLEKGADWGVMDGSTNSTPLHLACWKGSEDTVRILCKHAIENGFDLNPTDKEQHTPLYDASHCGHAGTVDLLFEIGKEAIQIETATHEKRTPLVAAALHGQTDVVQALIRRRANLMAQDSDGDTALKCAAQQGHEDIVQLLLAANPPPDVDLPNEDGVTPLNMAVWYGYEGIMKRLLEAKADIQKSTTDNWEPVNDAACYGHEGILRLLLEHGGRANINRPDSGGWTPLKSAARYGHAGAVRILLDTGVCDVNKPDSTGWTPIANACYRGHTGIVDTLLLGNANPVFHHTEGTLLHKAAAQGYAEILELLLRNEAVRAQLNVTDNEGKSALHVASASKHDDDDPVGYLVPGTCPPGMYLKCIKLLLDAGIDAGLTTKKGETALHLAAGAGMSERSGLLLERCADSLLNAKDGNGETALDICVKKRDRESATAVVKRGAQFSKAVNDNDLLFWAAESEDTHGVVKLMLIQDIKTEEERAVALTGWCVLELAAHLGDCLIVQKLLTSLSGAQHLEMIGKAKEIVELRIRSDNTLRENTRVKQAPQKEKGKGPATHKGASEAGQGEGKVTGHGVAQEKGENMKNDAQDEGKDGGDNDAKVEGKNDGKGDRKDNASALYRAILTLLNAAEISTKISTVAKKLEAPAKAVDTNFEPHASIFDFYSTEIASMFVRQTASVGELIYDKGPQRIMDEVREKNKEARQILEKMGWSKGEESAKPKGRTLEELLPIERQNFRWIHLPANHMQWMDDLTAKVHFERVHKPAQENKQGEPQAGQGPGASAGEAKDGPQMTTENEPDESHADKEDADLQVAKEAPQNATENKPAGPHTAQEDVGARVARDGSQTTKKKTSVDPKKDKVDVEITAGSPFEFTRLMPFLSGSYAEFPDASSSSRVMKPRCVVLPSDGNIRIQAKAAAAKKANEARNAGKGGGAANASTADNEAGTIVGASEPVALYMPYLIFGDQRPDMKRSDQPFADSQCLVHGSQTLDEYYYQFGSDRNYEQGDIDKRNRDQVVSKWLHGGDGKLKNCPSWVVVRVDQLWLWVITPDTIVTSSTHRLDGRKDIVPEAVSRHLQRSQPQTAMELVQLIVSACIRLYDQTREPKPVESTVQTDNGATAPETVLQDGNGLAMAETTPQAGNEGVKGGSTNYGVFSDVIEFIGSLFGEVKAGETAPQTDSSTIAAKAAPQAANKRTIAETVVQTGIEGANHGSTIHGIFSSSINQVALEEAKLFDSFTDQANGDDNQKARMSVGKEKVRVPAKLLCKVKDLRDELNILRAVLSQQQKVERDLSKVLEKDKGRSDKRGFATPLLDGINEMDKYVARLYDAVQATLALEQNMIGIEQGEEAARQGKQIMVFTITTIVFLPLSFFVAFFAVNVTEFSHDEEGNIRFSAAIVFPVLVGSLIITALVIMYVRREHLRQSEALRKWAAKGAGSRVAMVGLQQDARVQLERMRYSLVPRRVREKDPENGPGEPDCE